MARIMTARELSTTQIIAIRDDVKARLLAMAVRETGKGAVEFVIRDGMAKQDFGLGSEKWDNESQLTTVDWTKDWSKELSKTKFVAFYGVCNHSNDPTIIGTKFKIGVNGQTTKDVAMYGKMYVEDVPKAFFDPVFYKGADTIYIEHYASGSTIAAGGEEIELFCLVAEPYGDVISTVPK